MDGLKLKLETAYKASGGRKVNIISHSMGGVLILCFMSLHRDVSIFFLHHYLRNLCSFYNREET
jgi:triacylglycerol esterase/lipase EstA (alpha/beta hydrolase family)